MNKALIRETLLAGILLVAFLSNSEAFTQDIKIDDARRAYVTKMVTAENVKGIEVRLVREVVMDDCNTHTLSVTNVLVSGEGDGWHDQYFFDAQMTQTKMFCPSDKPKKGTVSSRPVFIKSFANENVNRKVVVSIVIPEGYQLDVRAVK